MKTIIITTTKVILVISLVLMTISSQAQVLDLESTTEGALLPRMTSAQRTAITAATLSPSEMVYDTDTKSFWYWEDMQWNELAAGSGPSASGDEIKDADDDTKIQVEESADEDIIRFDIGGTEMLTLTKNVGGRLVIEPRSDFFNTIIGENAALNMNAGSGTSTIIGADAGKSITSSAENTLVGTGAGQNLINTNGNTFIGRWAGRDNTGSANTFLGNYAGLSSTSSSSVFIGQRAGQNESNNNRLYIDNSSTSNPLIYGEFDNNLIRINGDLTTNSGSGFFRTDSGGLPTSYGVGVRVYHETASNTGRIFTYDYMAGAPVDMTIQATGGRLAIGGDFADGYKLSVDGKIACEEVLVDLSGDWPDYVFQPEYELKSLEEVQNHINDKGHLPGVPSAQEVEENGIQVGEMNKVLMEKVEELTLYILEQDKALKAAEAARVELDKRLQALENK